MKLVRNTDFSCGGDCSNASARLIETEVDKVLEPLPNLNRGSWVSAVGMEVIE